MLDTNDIESTADGRPSVSSSPHGAATSYAYQEGGRIQTATTNGRRVRKTLDGFGRVVKEESGYLSGSTLVVQSVVDTEYGPCACSPLGKVKRSPSPMLRAGQSGPPTPTMAWDAHSA